MWRSFVAARASLSPDAHHLNSLKPHTPNHFPLKPSPIYLILLLPQRQSFPLDPLLTKTIDSSPKPQVSTNLSDSEPRLSESPDANASVSPEADPFPESFAQNGGARMNNFAPSDGIEQGSVSFREIIVPTWTFSASDELYEQFPASTEENGDTQMEKKEQVHATNVEQLENLLLLQSSSDGSLESGLVALGLTLHEEFVVRI
ncbi:hypothetical protein PanWU01x14_188850 [Parasponia andersonii]|uniref:Uncharacterized protein n=1 Tax=Parasponia andersonii TaxID=3476 RepID=A0A2P5C307_PARAD|nr:hypothetical protein PanWU01x14_188850 [Parasponia andersonii]